MLIPARRFLWLALVPLAVVLAGRGASAAVVAAWGAMVAVLAGGMVDGLWAAGRWRRVRLKREAPAQLHVDQPEPISWTIENPDALPLSIRLADRPPRGARAEPPALAALAPPRSRRDVSYTLVAAERGPAAFGDLDCRVLGPLGLAWFQKRLPARQDVRCLPRLANAKAAELAERRALLRQAGSHRFRWRGTGTSFESLREYSTQDDIRWVDWKATARRGRPISRNFETERHQQVMLLVDASRSLTTYCGHRTKFDAMLEAAVLTARAALNQGDGLGLLVFSDQVEAYLHPRRERAQLTAVIESLYDRKPRLVEPNYETALTLAAQRNGRRSLFVVLTDLTVIEAARRMLLYLRAIAPRHLALVVTIADETIEQHELIEPRAAEELYRVGAAAEFMYERTLLLEELRRRGVEVLDSPADQVAARTIERYLDLKRRLRI